jgi:peptide/nickel transport system permease protein
MRYLYRRFAFCIVALWASVTLNFLLPRIMPGSPIDAFMARFHGELSNNPHMMDSLRTVLGGSNAPLPVQYVQYLGSLLHGDFGVSYSQFPARVSEILAATVPWTLFLAGASTLLAGVLGTLLGIIASWRRGGIVDTVLTPATMFSQSLPPFFLALVLLYVFGFVTGWFPLEHSYGDTVHPGFNLAFFADVGWHAALPLAAIMLLSVGGWMLGMRSVMINVLADDYITMAQAKGLRDRRIMFGYAARNALLPQLTSFAITVGYVVSGLLLIEYVFSYPGVGYTLVNAVQAADYPLMQALLLLITVAVLLANLIADLLYARLDPRVRNT